MKAYLRLRSRRLNRLKGVDTVVITSGKAIKKTEKISTKSTRVHTPTEVKPSSPQKKDYLATLGVKLAEALMRGPNRRVVLRNRRILEA